MIMPRDCLLLFRRISIPYLLFYVPTCSYVIINQLISSFFYVGYRYVWSIPRRPEPARSAYGLEYLWYPRTVRSNTELSGSTWSSPHAEPSSAADRNG